MANQVVALGDFATPLNRATVTSGGALVVTGAGGSFPADTELPAAAALSDATENPTAPMVGAAMMLWNGTNWQRWASNLELTVLASAARTANVNSSDLSNFNGRGVHVIIDVTSVTATPSVVFTVQGKDAVSGKYYTLLTSAAITATGTTLLTVYPGAAVTANVSASNVVPKTWRVSAAHGDADSITYSVGAVLVL